MRKHTPKRVPRVPKVEEPYYLCSIFSPNDFKKRLSRRNMDERFHISTAQDKVKNSTKAPRGK
jgi:hypothetical protein